MTVITSFESLLANFLGIANPELNTYLATVFAILVFCGMLALFVGIFTKRAARYIGITAIIAVIAVTINYIAAYKFGIIPEGAVINVWV